MKRRLFLQTAASMGAFAASGFTSAALARAFTGSTSGVAINGYDPVAYFKQSKPVKGSSAFKAKWNGVVMHFSSAANRDTFLSNPTKYAPKYGGHCAFAAAKGYVAPTVPEAWSIVGGRLYLNYSLGVRKRWTANQAQFIKDGDKNWPKIK